MIWYICFKLGDPAVLWLLRIFSFREREREREREGPVGKRAMHTLASRLRHGHKLFIAGNRYPLFIHHF